MAWRLADLGATEEGYEDRRKNPANRLFNHTQKNWCEMTTEKNRGGRPSGSAWAHKRPVTMRKASKAARIEILAERDPLARLIEIAYDPKTPLVLQIKALSSAAPYLHPKLSMSVVAEATPEQAERITSEMLVRELSERIARLATIEHEPATIEAETDETDSDTD